MEEERITIKQRQAEGIAAAKTKGKHVGLPRKGLESLTKEQREQFDQLHPRWKAGEITATYFMGQLDINRSVFYKIVKTV